MWPIFFCILLLTHLLIACIIKKLSSVVAIEGIGASVMNCFYNFHVKIANSISFFLVHYTKIIKKYIPLINNLQYFSHSLVILFGNNAFILSVIIWENVIHYMAVSQYTTWLNIDQIGTLIRLPYNNYHLFDNIS